MDLPTVKEPTPNDWRAFMGLVRIVGALGFLLACAGYGGRLLERIETLGNQISGLTTAVNEVKLVTADVKALTIEVQTIVENQRAMVASDAELRRQVDDLRSEVLSLRALRDTNDRATRNR